MLSCSQEQGDRQTDDADVVLLTFIGCVGCSLTDDRLHAAIFAYASPGFMQIHCDMREGRSRRPSRKSRAD